MTINKKNKEYVEKLREEMITDDEIGRLYIDDKYKEDGYVYRIVDADRPGRVQLLEKKGYEVVHNEDLTVGQNTANNSSKVSSAVTMELGTTRHVQGILMRIPKELYDRRQQMKELKNKELDTQQSQTGIPTQFGEITIGNQKIT